MYELNGRHQTSRASPECTGIQTPRGPQSGVRSHDASKTSSAEMRTPKEPAVKREIRRQVSFASSRFPDGYVEDPQGGGPAGGSHNANPFNTFRCEYQDLWHDICDHRCVLPGCRNLKEI